ncbi:hypothetical protein AC579_9296 [Pseudocercospora musae]|uniref:Uncharacterized protein n=1 Tax=Pseudocercospora musae TaxID=113226 RepID=A0A139I588_9PEZI|nr:hypothetical protein AC579_9296 [Pseudocercospora musae]
MAKHTPVCPTRASRRLFKDSANGRSKHLNKTTSAVSGLPRQCVARTCDGNSRVTANLKKVRDSITTSDVVFVEEEHESDNLRFKQMLRAAKWVSSIDHRARFTSADDAYDRLGTCGGDSPCIRKSSPILDSILINIAEHTEL